MSISETLNQRQATHGDFCDVASVTQSLKSILRHAKRYDDLDHVHKEALDNICQKMARCVCGNANHADNWHDIAGYATLVEREIKPISNDDNHTADNPLEHISRLFSEFNKLIDKPLV